MVAENYGNIKIKRAYTALVIQVKRRQTEQVITLFMNIMGLIPILVCPGIWIWG